jgi:hypothetical protein
MDKVNTSTRERVLSSPVNSGVTQPFNGNGTKLIAKPTGTVSAAVTPDNSNLEEGGDKGGNSGRRYYFNSKAYNSLITWLLYQYKWQECRHIVFTIPDHEYWNHPYSGDLQESEEAQHEREKYWQDKFKKLLERLRWYNLLGEYGWFKELTKKKQTGQYDAGVIHWHFVHHGYLNFKRLNAIWSDIIRPHKASPHYKNVVRHRPKAAKLFSSNIARYFGAYFHKGDKFFTKAYRLPQLPGHLQGGKVEVERYQFDQLASQTLYELEFATVWKTDQEAYKLLVNGEL